MKSIHTKSTSIAALLVMTASSQGATLLLSDNFNTGNNTNLNIDLATRQDGTLEATGAAAPAGSTWTEFVTTSGAILSNQLNAPSSAGVRNNADFESTLTSINLTAVTGFTLDFKMDYTGAAGAWTSPYLTTHTGDERGNSRFGLVAFGDGSIQFYGGAVAGGQVTTAVSNATIAGLVSGWNITNQNTYSLVATRTTATTGIYDAFINGVEVASNIAYAFGTGGDNTEVNFEIINVANGAGLYDDLSLAVVPEPSAALLGGLGMLCLLRRGRI